MSNCTISGNTAAGQPLDAGSGGGGIHNFGTLTVTNSIISGNSVTGQGQGGGGIWSAGSLTIINTTVSGNSAAAETGGGIESSSFTLPNTVNTVNVINSTISGNFALLSGGGISIGQGSTVSVTNSTIADNSTEFDGSGISNDGALTLTNSTIAGNFTGSHQNSAGVFNDSFGTTTAINTIVARNNGLNCFHKGSPLVSNGHNIDDDGSCFSGGGTDLPNTDPMLGPLQDNGGPTFTMSLLAGSPALDAGDDAVLSSPYSLTTDQRGAPRKADAPVAAHPHVDIGALEFQLSGSTTTAVAANLDSPTVGQTITLTATVTGTPAIELGSPDGTVIFADAGNALGTVALISGIATFPTSSLNAGTHSITAFYPGAGAFAASTSPALSQTVNPAPTVTVLGSSSNPATVGNSVTFTAGVFSGFATPTGSVTFKDGNTTLGTGTLDAGGNAAFTTSALAAGSHSITAAYAGGANFAASTSSALAEIVTPVSTVTKLASSLNPANVGSSVTFTAGVVSGSGTPAGTVTFKDGSTTLGTGTLDAGGNAAFTTSALTAGSRSITAAYAGGGNFAASTSPALTEIVEPAQIVLSSSPPSQTVTAGGSATYNLTVGANGALSSPVSFSCIGLPQSASCSFSPNSVNAGSAGAPVTLSVSTTARTSAALATPFGHRFIYALALALPAVILLPATKRRRRTRILLWTCWPLLLLVLCLAGCGGKSSVGNTGTPAGTYTLGIVSSAGSTQNITPVTLVVQ